jgi:hypothetical protein
MSLRQINLKHLCLSETCKLLKLIILYTRTIIEHAIKVYKTTIKFNHIFGHVSKLFQAQINLS